jgi:hypothetical protein
MWPPPGMFCTIMFGVPARWRGMLRATVRAAMS